MNEPENTRWHNLIALSAPTFTGDDAPPYGFVTSTMARLREETRQVELAERIGMRALFASLALLFITAMVTLGLQYHDRSDLEPGLRGIVQVENVQLS